MLSQIASLPCLPDNEKLLAYAAVLDRKLLLPISQILGTGDVDTTVSIVDRELEVEQLATAAVSWPGELLVAAAVARLETGGVLPVGSLQKVEERWRQWLTMF